MGLWTSKKPRQTPRFLTSNQPTTKPYLWSVDGRHANTINSLAIHEQFWNNAQHAWSLNPQSLFVGWIPSAMNSKTNRCVVQKPYSVPCMRRTIPGIGIVKAEDIAIGNVGLGITSKAIHQKPFNNVGVQDRRRIPSPIVNHAILRWGTVNGKRRSTVEIVYVREPACVPDFMRYCSRIGPWTNYYPCLPAKCRWPAA